MLIIPHPEKEINKNRIGFGLTAAPEGGIMKAQIFWEVPL